MTARRLVQRAWPLLLAGCVAAMSCVPRVEDRTADGRVIVTYWEKWTGFEGEAMQAVVDDFNASQDSIFVDKLTVSEIDRKFLLATSGGNPPDVVGLWSHSINGYADKGALTPLDGAIRREGVKREDYTPVFWDLCRHRGVMWALPSTPATLALHWNKKLFRDAGLDPERPPQTLEELDRMAERLTILDIERSGQRVRVCYPDLSAEEKEGKNFEIVQIGHLPQEPGWWLEMWIYWFGGRFWDGDRKILSSSPENLEAYTWIRSHAEKYGVSNLRSFGSSFGNPASPQNPFLAGKVAMVLQGVWQFNFIEKYAPHLEWGAAAFPARYPEPGAPITIVECDALVIPRGAQHPREAFEFIRYVNTQGPMEKLALGQRKFSALTRHSEAFVREHPNPCIETFIALAGSSNACYVPRMPIWPECKEEMRNAGERVLSLRIDPQDALMEAQARIQWRLDRAMRRWDKVGEARQEEWGEYDAW